MVQYNKYLELLVQTFKNREIAMGIESKITYNKEKAQQYGWTPQDFGATGFDEDLILKITKFQLENGITADGCCGSHTHRALKTTQLQSMNIPPTHATGEYIICNSKRIQIHWNKVVTWNEPNGLKASSFRKYNAQRDIKCFITHWDATLSSHHCARILEERKLSVHFMIDNDGTIYQMADTNDICYHAKGANDLSIGVEISNAYDLKWQDWYVSKGFGERPIIRNAKCHNHNMKPFLGFYPIQLQALTALYEAINKGCNIPLVAPKTKTTTDESVVNGSFRGFCSHYHLTENKIDCAGLDIDDLCQKAITLKSSNS